MTARPLQRACFAFVVKSKYVESFLDVIEKTKVERKQLISTLQNRPYQWKRTTGRGGANPLCEANALLE